MKIFIYAAETHKILLDVGDKPDGFLDGRVVIHNFPETNRAEYEQVEWIFDQIEKDHSFAVKTNSCHIFNAIRVMVKEGLVKAEDVEVLFVDKTGFKHVPIIDQDGRFDHWPEHMFDTYAQMLRRLL